MHLSPNKRRVVNTRAVTYTEGAKRSKTVFGFMSLNGNDVVMVSDGSRSMDMEGFIGSIRAENGSAPIIAVMDNARIHAASSVVESASNLGIDRAFLPPYSPDLNPIEFGWKDAKRELSSILDFDMMIGATKDTVLRLFRERKNGYADYWIRSFLCPES